MYGEVQALLQVLVFAKLVDDVLDLASLVNLKGVVLVRLDLVDGHGPDDVCTP